MDSCPSHELRARTHPIKDTKHANQQKGLWWYYPFLLLLLHFFFFIERPSKLQ